MTDLSLTCPHCETQKAGFTLMHAEDSRAFRKGYILMTCNYCHQPLLLIVECYEHPCSSLNCGTRSLLKDENYFKILETYPKLKPIDVPDHLPEGVADSFLQAKKSIANQLWDSAGMMCRKALERSLTYIYPEKKGKLKDRIDAAAQVGLISPDLKDWAHEIRIDGNEAAHEDDFTREEEKDLVNFTEMLLTYLFTLPSMVNARKVARKQVQVTASS